MGTMMWFGHRYDAPAWEDMEETPHPVGQRCLQCNERIGANDDGLTLPYEREYGTATREPWHIHCFFRSVLGPGYASWIPTRIES